MEFSEFLKSLDYTFLAINDACFQGTGFFGSAMNFTIATVVCCLHHQREKRLKNRGRARLFRYCQTHTVIRVLLFILGFVVFGNFSRTAFFTVYFAILVCNRDVIVFSHDAEIRVGFYTGEIAIVIVSYDAIRESRNVILGHVCL